MKKFHWDEVPFLRLLIPFIIGIILFTILPPSVQLFWTSSLASYLSIFIFAICLVLMFVFSETRKLAANYQLRWFFGFATNILFIIFGFSQTSQYTQITKNAHFSYHLSDSTLVMVQINEPPIEKEKSYKAELKVSQIFQNEQGKEVIGKAIAYFKKDSTVSQLKYGDWLLLNVKFQEIAPPPNPYQFDYKAYLSYQNIYHQAYLKPSNWTKLPYNQTSTYYDFAAKFYDFIYGMRNFLLYNINEHIDGEKQKAVASALLLGYKHLLEDDLVAIYSHTGAMHVLAVSGLHVGIIAGFIGFLLSFLDKRGNNGRRLKVILMLLTIWIFAFITGMPPSVMRASLMFSFWIIALNKKHYINTYNIIATSAFFLLLSNPFLIKHVGFQLSYMAVIFIIWLQPKIYNVFTIKNKLLDYLWALTAVSIAAQLGTLPLSLYYFNQFPFYFLLSNMVVIPAAGLILSIGVLLFIFATFSLLLAPFSYLAALVGDVLNWLIWIQNRLLFHINELPISSIKGLSISNLQFYFIYAMIISIALFLIYKQSKHFRWALAFLVVLAGLNAIYQYDIQVQKGIYVYHVNNATAIDFMNGKQSVIIADSGFYNNKKLALFNVQQNHTKSGIKKQNMYKLKNDTIITHQKMSLWPPFIQFYDKRVMLLDKNNKYALEPTNDVEINYLVLTQNTSANLYKLAECVHFERVIIDASNSFWKTNKWIEQCKNLDIPYHNTREKGAFVMKWK
ncbi:MAG: ComEC/Rec2 family competence protein [Chitinophagales bacterium]